MGCWTRGWNASFCEGKNFISVCIFFSLFAQSFLSCSIRNDVHWYRSCFWSSSQFPLDLSWWMMMFWRVLDMVCYIIICRKNWNFISGMGSREFEHKVKQKFMKLHFLVRCQSSLSGTWWCRTWQKKERIVQDLLGLVLCFSCHDTIDVCRVSNGLNQAKVVFAHTFWGDSLAHQWIWTPTSNYSIINHWEKKLFYLVLQTSHYPLTLFKVECDRN